MQREAVEESPTLAPKQSGTVIGSSNVERLKAYINQLVGSGRGLPAQRGRVNVSAVALACGFDRAVLYQNPTARQVLATAAKTLGLDAQVARREFTHADLRDQRIQKLEQENANLKAEIFELRRALRRFEHIEEMMTETGKRVS